MHRPRLVGRRRRVILARTMAAPRTVLVLDQFSDIGGAQRCLLELLPAAHAFGWTVRLAVPGRGRFTHEAERLGIALLDLPLGAYALGRKGPGALIRFHRESGRLASWLAEVARAETPALIYANGPRVLPAIARAGLGRPVLFHSHSLVTFARGRPYAKWALRRTGATIVAASRRLARQWPSPVRVIYGGVGSLSGEPVTRPAGPPELGDAASGPRIGIVGRWTEGKGQREFVQAARILEARHPSARFVVCGDTAFDDPRGAAYARQVRAQAPGSVAFLGWRDDVGEVLAGLDLLVLPSAEEGGIPSIVLEAFAAKTPVLATAVGGLPEILSDAVNGFVLEDRAPGTMAATIARIVARPDQLTTVAERAHQDWRERFTAERFQREVFGVMAEITPPE